ncbi:MAG: glycosyltransferase family 4 protein [Clostridia bacterium]|nr:glycosyltransferase family 4 protein [Clostridia bacterium]MDD4386827.1 glycosyltransferase family 4 protein [Clostridia bacterium]
MNNKVKLNDYEKLELKYKVMEEKFSLMMNFLNSRAYRKFFSKYLSISRKIRGLSLKDLLPKNIKKSKNPKIALIIDKEDWAFANIATQIVNNLSKYYDFYVIQTEIINKIEDVLLLVQDCDLVHFFWRGFLYESIDEYNLIYATEKLGIDYKMFLNEFVKNLNLSTCVYDHMFLHESEKKITKKITDLTNNYYVSSNILKEIYYELPIDKKPIQVITDGVDLNKFKPTNLKRFNNIATRNIVIGWVGNSKWGEHDKKFNDVKGVNTILKPAIKQLIKEGYKVEMYFADRNERMIPHDKMSEYYNKIDIYICTSETEGTPNPALEAMACGVPVISTNVGVIKDLFGVKQQKLILEERSIECLKQKILYLIKNTDEFTKLSEENLVSIKSWSWENKCKDFRLYFDKCLKN